MVVEPQEWNVAVVGYRNNAILTPSGIGKHLFELTEGEPLKVEVSVDGVSPYRVHCCGVIVMPGLGSLVLATETPTLANLKDARAAAIRAIRALPKTPLSAAGFNTRFGVGEAQATLRKGVSDRARQNHCRKGIARGKLRSDRPYRQTPRKRREVRQGDQVRERRTA
jgi:hypothetical protein